MTTLTASSLLRTLVVITLVGGACWELSQAAEPVPMPTIRPGTSFTDRPPEGWSNIILFVEGRLGSGDLDVVSAKVERYSKMFNLVVLADVSQEEGVYRLEKTGVGFTTKIKGRNTVITVDTEEDLGAELGIIARSVFKANEESLHEIRRVTRTKNHVLFDAPTIMLHQGEHETMMVRYLVWASPKTGNVKTFVWLMKIPEAEGNYTLVESALQMLPENMKEDRVMNVKGDRFTFGIPAKDAFALVRIPQGAPIKFTPRLAKVATLYDYDTDSFTELLLSITEAVDQTSTKRDL